AHPLMGALVAKKWNVPSETCQLILHYADPCDARTRGDEADIKTAIVQLSDLISHAAGIGNPEGYPEQLEKLREIALFAGFTEKSLTEDLTALIDETKEQFERERSVYE